FDHSFKGASFRSIHTGHDIGDVDLTQFIGNFSGAHFTDATVIEGRWQFADFRGADFSGFFGEPFVSNSRLDFDAYQILLKGSAVFHDENTIYIRTSDNLEGAVVDGSAVDGTSDTFVWPTNVSTGRPALAGMSFKGAKL